MRWLFLVTVSFPLLAACGNDTPGTTLPEFDDPNLMQGKNTWMQVCRNCHLNGVAGAPAISDATGWTERMSKGLPALYRNAIEGIQTDQGWSMPPKGGNERLADEDIRQAVDYMLAAQAEISAQTE